MVANSVGFYATFYRGIGLEITKTTNNDDYRMYFNGYYCNWNILRTSYNQVGIGIAIGPQGLIISQDFTN